MRLNDAPELPRSRSIFRQKSDTESIVFTENVAEDISTCLYCIKRMTETKIVIDAMKVFQGVLMQSQRFEECKEDKAHNQLQWAIQTETKGFVSGTVYKSAHNSDAVRVDSIQLL